MNKPKKTPTRMCVISREKLPKNELIRIVKNKENQVFIDLTGKQNGRGVYLQKNTEVYKKAKKTKILNKLLEIEVDDSLFDELEKI